jgi:nitrite reductase/ring-hydroxylating ferredoxin subunit
VNGSVTDFLSEVQSDLANGVLSPRVYNDLDLHRAELDRIFTRCWIFVGHVSEIPSPGDYLLRYVGEDQFILVRDEDGQIHLLLNNCMHRAAAVCRAERGNTSHFRCPYHGWIYKNNGDWNGAPQRARTYRKLDARAWGLRKAPHVDTYHGLIFANLDPDAISLREYLGDMCFYLDIALNLHEEGMSVAAEPHRWVIPANWKSGPETFTADSYHGLTLHKSIEELGLIPDTQRALELLFHVGLEGGHGLLLGRHTPGSALLHYPDELRERFDLDRLSDSQRSFMEKFHVVAFTIFPNLSFLFTKGVWPRIWQPYGCDKLQLWTFNLVWNAAAADYKRFTQDSLTFEFGSSGILEQDDGMSWRAGPLAGRSPFARKTMMKMNYQMGAGAMGDYEVQPDWQYPGTASNNVFGERNQLNWWRRWCEEMTSSE